MEFPEGISLHRPGPGTLFLPKENIATPTTSDTSDCLHNGDVALVFGSDAGEEAAIERFSCVSLQPANTVDGPRKKVLLPEDIPPMFESYAEVPPFHERPFQGILQDVNSNRVR